MKELVNNCTQVHEFGDDGCFAELTPLEISIEKDKDFATILYQYTDGRTIYLCSFLRHIDLADFGIKAHKEYILRSYDDAFKTKPIIILKSNNEKVLIEYKEKNAHLLPSNRYFSISSKIIVDENLPLTIKLR